MWGQQKIEANTNEEKKGNPMVVFAAFVSYKVGLVLSKYHE